MGKEGIYKKKNYFYNKIYVKCDDAIEQQTATVIKLNGTEKFFVIENKLNLSLNDALVDALL